MTHESHGSHEHNDELEREMLESLSRQYNTAVLSGTACEFVHATLNLLGHLLSDRSPEACASVLLDLGIHAANLRHEKATMPSAPSSVN